MRRSSSINMTDASSEYVDEATYNISPRTKDLMTNIDTLLDNVEKQLKQEIKKYFLKPLARAKKDVAQTARQNCEGAIDDWRKTIQNRINADIAETELKRLLYTLDEVDAQEREKNPDKEAWRPSGHPSTDMRDFFLLRASDYGKQLKEAIEEVRKELTVNEQDVEKGREKVMGTDKELAAVRKEIAKRLKTAKGKSDGKAKTMSNEELTRAVERMRQLLK